MSFGNIFIIGDSYSTFKGLVPEGHSIYYPRESINVQSPDETWWRQVIDKTEATLVLNDSSSGTTVCNTGYDGRDCRDNSFIARLDKNIKNGFFSGKSIDTAIVFGGTNDNWAGAPVGEISYGEISEEEKYMVLPAFSYLMQRLTAIPEIKRVIVVINEGFKPEIENGILETAKHFGAHPVLLNGIEKVEGHPNKAGMTAIAEQVIAFERTI